MKVPIYQEQVKPANQVSYGGAVKTTVENFGGGGANIATQLEPAVKIYQEQKKKADQIRVNEAEARLTELETRLLYDKDSGALHKKGKNSFGAYEETSTEYDKRVLEIENELSNDEQKGMLRQSALQKKLSIDRQLQNHISQETVRYDNEATASAIKMEGIAAQENYKDLSRIQLSIDNQKKYMDQFIERNGLSKEEADLKKAEIIASTHEGVINRMLSEDHEVGAQAYLKAVKEKQEISGDSLTRVEKSVEAGANRKQAQDSVDNYLAKGLSESAAYKQADIDFSENSKLREEAEQRISVVYSRKDSARSKYLEDTTTRMFRMVEAGKDPRKDPAWHGLPASETNAVMGYIGRFANGDEATTDVVLYNKLKNMAADENTRNKFMKESLVGTVNKLNKKQFDELTQLQADMRAGKLDGAVELGTKQKIFNDQLAALGIDDDKKKGEIALKMSEMQTTYYKTQGKQMSDDEYKIKFNKLLTEEIKTKGLMSKIWEAQFGRSPDFLTSGKKMIDLSAEDVDAIPYSQLPKEEIIKLEKHLKSKNIKFNQKFIEETVKAKIKRDYGIK